MSSEGNLSPSFGQRREFRSSCEIGYFLYSHAGLLPQSLHVLGIGLFLVLSLIIQLSWAPVTPRAVLPGMFPSRPWKKPESTLLESRVAVLLLFILLPSGSWIPLTRGSCSQCYHGCTCLALTSLTSFSLFVSNKSSREHLLVPLITGIEKFFATLKTTPELLVFHLAALPGDTRVVKIPNEDQGLWMEDFYLLAADACHITLLFSYLWDLSCLQATPPHKALISSLLSFLKCVCPFSAGF